MKTLKKHIDCGVYSFDVAIDRDIAIEALEEYPALAEYVFTQAEESAKKPSTKKETETDFVIRAIKEKRLKDYFQTAELLKECAKFAFPKMLKKAGSDLNAQEIIEYVYENNVQEEFCSNIFQLVILVFTQREVGVKKVNFSMK